MTIRRALLVAQDKGGTGKTVLVRALAESVVSARILELEHGRRLVELESRVDFFKVRADRADVDRTGGAAARSEYDQPLDLMARKLAAGAEGPEVLIVDIGANAGEAFLSEVAARAARYGRLGVEFAFLTVVTNEPGAASSAPVVLDLVRPFAKRLFVVENQVQGAVDPKVLKALGKNVTLSRLQKLTLDDQAIDLLQKGGLKFIAEQLADAEDNLADQFGFSAAGRIVADLTAFRARAMEAVAPAAAWLESGV